MSAGMEDQPSTATKYESITVTLSHNDPTSSSSAFPVRNIRFSAAQPKVLIGRASKTISKGLTPTENNAYFDSPVMSREHAEMTADLDEGLIFLRDNRSLHGTAVNETPLPHESLQRLNDGDTVRFGIHVARGLEVFNPASVLVNITPHSKSAETPSRAYTAPDPTDEMSDCVSEADCTNSVRLSSVESDGIISDAGMRASSDSDGESVRIVSPPLATKDGSKPSSLHQSGDPEVPVNYGETESVVEDDHHEENDHSSYIFPSEEVDSEEEISADYSSEEDDDGLDENGEIKGRPGYVLDDDDVDEDVHEDDDGSRFLSVEISRLTAATTQANHNMTSRPLVDPSAPVDGLWTPPSASAVHSSDEAGPPDEDGAQNILDVHMEDDGRAAGNADSSSLHLPPVSALATKKYNISSILNPSPPPSSPNNLEPVSTSFSALGYCEARDDVFHVAPDFHVATGPQTAQAPDPTSPQSLFASRNVAVPVFPDAQKSVPEESEHGVMDMLEYFAQKDAVKLPEAPLFAVAEESMDVDTTKEDEEEYAMTSAATFSAWKKKRKADEMLGGSAEADAAVSAATPVAAAVETNASSDSLPAASPAKRPATEAAMQANRKLKKVAWAIAEKVGIAALGGAVVLGSLIYTAPSF